MAIAKVQYKENASATPEVWMDTTQKTVTSGSMLSGITALQNDGTGITGNIASKSSSDLTASSATVTAPAGYYPNAASKAVASGSATTPATSITANPTISVNASGLITASVSGSKSVTPAVSAGYVSAGTAGTVTGSGSNTQQLSTQAAATITPSTTSQTAVAAGKYTTGAVTVAAMPSGTAGTPTATKGTVSNHSVSITPSVTNTTGYITGGTKNGTAVTVNVAELESGTKTITENGTGISVSGYSSVDVDVPGQEPTGIKYIWTDFDGEGAWDVSGYAKCAVDGAPIGDDAFVLWLNIPQDNYVAKVYFYYASSTEQTIDWGDGTVETSAKSGNATNTHVYSQAGRYVVVVKNGGIVSNYCVGQTTSDPNGTLVFAEIPGASGADNKTAVFAYCSALKKIYFHDGITSFGANYAMNCTSLESVRLPSTLTSIGSAFHNCASLSKVSLPYGLVTIGTNAFYNCSSLKYLEIPSTVTSIGANALSYIAEYGTEKSTYVFLPATPPTIQSTTFSSSGSGNVKKIYVPAASLDAYKTATNWSTYASHMEAIPE